MSQVVFGRRLTGTDVLLGGDAQDRVADLEAGVLDPRREAMVGAGTPEREKMPSGLQDPERLASPLLRPRLEPPVRLRLRAELLTAVARRLASRERRIPRPVPRLRLVELSPVAERVPLVAHE